MIDIQHVRKVFATPDGDVVALADITLTIPTGAMVALMGPSGSGKTTLLNIIGAMDAPSSGQVTLDGISVERLDAEERAAFRRRIGFVFQRFALIATASAYENMEFALRIAGVDRTDWQRRILHALDILDMNDHAHHRPGELSGGQQQRIAVARAICIEPKILIVDEPTANLDSQRGAAVLNLFRSYAMNGTTIVMSTHDPTSEKYATDICRLRAGAIEQYHTTTLPA
jgi:ABC-type lipoprotein export system ATPase subunit